jgi:hypothetical protein
MVKLWESKNAQRALKGSGLTLMAMSLTACGSDSDDAVVVTPPVVTPPVVTPANLALTTGQDIVTSAQLTTANDTVTATQATFTSTDVIVDSSSTDSDTLTISASSAISATPTVAGIENIVINNASFSTLSHALTNISDGTITVNNVQLAGATSATFTGAGNVKIVAGTGVSGTLTVTETTDATTVVDAGSATAVSVTATGADQVVDVVANGDITLTVATATDLNLTASVASEVTLTPGALDTITGDANTTVTFADLGSFTGDTITGAALVKGTTVTVDTDVSKISSPMELTAITATKTVTVADNADVTLTAGTTAFTVELKDDTNTSAVAKGDLDLTLAGDYTGVISAGTSGDIVSTVNVAATKAQTALDVRMNTTDGAINLSGAKNIVLASTSTAKTISAASMTGNLTATATASAKSITGGAGDDTITAVTAVAQTLVGGAGNDTLVAAADMDEVTFSGFEVFDATANVTAMDASQFTTAMTVIGGNVTIDNADIATVDFSIHTVSSAVGFTFDGTLDTTVFASTQGLTITGNVNGDTLTGTANADTISGGAGGDSIVGAAGADAITGGEGADNIVALGGDTIVLTETTSAADNVVMQVITAGSTAGAAGGTFTGYNVVTGFTSGTDDFVFDDGTTAANIFTDTVAALDVVISATNIYTSDSNTGTADDLALADVTDVDAVLGFINASAYTTSTATQSDIVAITFDDFTAMYVVTDAVAGADITAAELTMLGTVDEVLVSGDMVIA